MRNLHFIMDDYLPGQKREYETNEINETYEKILDFFVCFVYFVCFVFSFDLARSLHG
jgi:hypothetical protein